MKNVSTSFKRAVLALCLVALSATAIFANDYVKFKGWKQAETTHFRFIYEDASEQAAQAYAKIADEAWEKIARIYSMPQEKTNVYVFSRLNVVNAYTFFSPPEIVMFDSPVLTSLFGFRDDWMKLFFTHELIHIANITFEDKSYLAAKLMGEAFRGMDYSMIPGWALEGLTTVLETELTNGGRGRSPYFELDFKAPTMDNNLIPYRLIGTEQEPPSGQIYVMGYLIMRSIADRWGLQALADIERNRTGGKSWEDSVYLVTGETPQEIYRKVKIALEKRYAKERQIPEGKIISTNDTNTYYSKPAIILDDGSIIINKSSSNQDATVVLLKPGEKDGILYYEDLDENNSDFKKARKETILFKGAESITADQDMNVYATLPVSRYDRQPGNETQFPLYKWTKDTGLVQLTHDESSYYQPAVSRNGKLLVAVEQTGLKMRLIQVDTQTGEKTVLFQDERYSFIQPALNADGSKIAFLLLKDDRACIALGDPVTKQYKIVNNTDFDFITDPSNPFFNSDGNLTFCSNDRGRLEIFEAKLNSDGQTFTYTPMLADPIAALWAYKNDIGIYYLSESSTGSIIKIKPVEEWGKVPDFDGPSPAGQIMTFGELTDDYPNFEPYKNQATKPAEIAAADAGAPAQETAGETDDEDTAATDKEENTGPVKHRSQEKLDQLENLEPPVKELTNQKRYVPFVQPVFYLPFVDVLEAPDNYYTGFGITFAGLTPRLQMKQGVVFFDLFYYPQINNITGELFGEFFLPYGTLDLILVRDTMFSELIQGTDSFTLQNYAVAGYTLPLISRDEYATSKELSLLASATGVLSQCSDKAFSLTDNLPFAKTISFQAGIEYNQKLYQKKDNYFVYSITNMAIGAFDFTKNKVYAGYEGEINFETKIDDMCHQLGVVVRYTDFPLTTSFAYSRAHFNGTNGNALFPGKLLLSYTYIIPDLISGVADGNLVFQGMASFGKNTVDGGTPETGMPLNLYLDKRLNAGFELCFDLGLTKKLAIGYTGLFDFTKDISQSQWNFYVTCKINWLRF